MNTDRCEEPEITFRARGVAAKLAMLPGVALLPVALEPLYTLAAAGLPLFIRVHPCSSVV
jgi:hypothetical protein